MLRAMGRDARVAVALGPLLVDQPYLGWAHEAAVDDLVAAAARHRLPRRLIPELLFTLWRNEQSTGARSVAELAGMALAAREGAHESRRIAALQLLLVLPGAQYRDLVLDQVERARSRAAAGDLMLTGAKHLPRRQALAVLRRLSVLCPEQLSTAVVRLEQRSPDSVAAAPAQ